MQLSSPPARLSLTYSEKGERSRARAKSSRQHPARTPFRPGVFSGSGRTAGLRGLFEGDKIWATGYHGTVVAFDECYRRMA